MLPIYNTTYYMFFIRETYFDPKSLVSRSRCFLNEMLDTFGVSLSQFNSANLKNLVVSHAQGKIKDSV